ncbi:Calx-beta domain-containing protein [Aureliella helgolandensis]|uniref:Calx-beta domain protein n=1 Tax=Aureliella helgolandensis TaxID=2527968 RepID=A0A518GDV4_9BACT|nr:Calx-beta domain-containing protein [Aureliella helgolandensis]QDV26785.1 Calx-beta domain protein [Aureliella helgolandensis]
MSQSSRVSRKKKSPRRNKLRARLRLRLESLEDRRLLAGLLFDSVVLAGGDDHSVFPQSAAVDAAGNTYRVGSMLGETDFDLDNAIPGGFNDQADFGPFTVYSQGASDGFVAKLDSSGTFQWGQSCEGVEETSSSGLVVSEQGQAFVTGAAKLNSESTLPQSMGTDIRQFDSAGSELWSHLLPGDAYSNARVSSTATGELVVSGGFRGDIDLDPGVGEFLVSGPTDNSGTPFSALLIGGTGNELSPDVQTDSNGNLLVIGTSSSTTSDFAPDPINTANHTNPGFADAFVLSLGPRMPGDPVTLFGDSFEQGEWNGNWVEDSQNDWARTTQRAADGLYAAEIDGSASNATLSQANPLDLTGYGSAELTFSWYIESSFDRGEYIALDLYDGNSWNEVASLKGNVDQENSWHNETVSIDGSYLVSDFQLRFRSKVSSSREDGFVDNVKMEGMLASSELAINDVQLAEGDSGTSGLVFTVARSGNTSGTSTVEFSTADVTANSSSDYGVTSGTITFAPGELSKTITVPVNGDTTIESDELFVVNLSNATDATIVDGIGQGTIQDDDNTPTIAYLDFSAPVGLNLVGAAAAPVGAYNSLRLTPQLTSQQGAGWYATPQLVAVGFETTFEFQTNGSGSDGFAFVIQNSGVDALGGAGSGLGYKGVPNSLAIEFDTFQNSETNDPNNNHVGIHTLGIAPNSNLESASLGTVTPAFDINDGNVHQVKVVYQPGTMSVFLDDLSTPALTVAVDLAHSLDLNVGTAWVGFTGVSGGGAQSHDILNWDYRALADTSTTIAVGNTEVIEGNAGPVDLVFTVMRQGDTSGTTTVDWATANGTATAGSDFLGSAGQIAFGPGDTLQTIAIAVNGDTVVEAHESLFVNLSGAVGATIVDDRGQGTILNDESFISIDAVSVVEGDESIQLIDAVVSAGNAGLDTPGGMVFGPDGNLYVASKISDSILRYDVATGEFGNAFVLSGSGGLANPHGLVFGPDGNLYVTSRLTDEVLRYNGATGAFIDSFVTAGSGGMVNPIDLAFGPDGELYVSSRDTDQVLRYDGTTGAFRDTFVLPGSGGLDNPHGLVFGPDGNLYVTSPNTDPLEDGLVLRYDGTTGAFIDVFVTAGHETGGINDAIGLVFGPGGDLYVGRAGGDSVLRYDGTSGALIESYVSGGSGGLDYPLGLLFDADGNLYVSSRNTDEVLRYGAASQAVFTVSLSSPSASPVSVAFSTANATATAGNDYAATSGTLTFEPGSTSRTIIVSTLNDSDVEGDETFAVTLSNAVGSTITDGTGIGTIVDNDFANVLPTASAGIDQTISDGDNTSDQSVNLNGSGSDSDGSIVSYQWREGTTVLGNAASITPNLSVGVHTLTLIVTDNDGATASDSLVVTIHANQGPTANAGGDQNVFDADNSGSQAVTLVGSGNDNDGTIAAYQWTEGTTTLGNTATISPNLSIGTHMLTLTVTDNGGATASDTILVTVLEAPTEAVLFEDSFEVGSNSNDWNGKWGEDSQNDFFRSTQRSTAGVRSAEVDGRATNATLTTSAPIDISGYASAELTFDWLIERGFDRGEYLSLDVSTNGGASWTQNVRQLRGNVDAENSWHSESVDLGPYNSSELKIRFRSYVSSSSEDANVDNVRIVGSAATASLMAVPMMSIASSQADVELVPEVPLESRVQAVEGSSESEFKSATVDSFFTRMSRSKVNGPSLGDSADTIESSLELEEVLALLAGDQLSA